MQSNLGVALEGLRHSGDRRWRPLRHERLGVDPEIRLAIGSALLLLPSWRTTLSGFRRKESKDA